MTGATDEIDPLDLLPDSVSRNDWHLTIRGPGIGPDYIGGPLVLRDSMGLVYTRGLDITHLAGEPH